MRTVTQSFLLACACMAAMTQAFVVVPLHAVLPSSLGTTTTTTTKSSSSGTAHTPLMDSISYHRQLATVLSAHNNNKNDNIQQHQQQQPYWMLPNLQRTLQSLTLAVALSVAPVLALSPTAAVAKSDSTAIVTCLLRKCPVPLAKCIANPACLANVACINTCTGKPDEIECQIKCGDLFENPVIGEFNKCAVSDMDCVKQQPDDGSYPVPAADKVVPKFDTKLFEGRWYITAGQNPLFDIFPCQVHFFSATGKDSFVGKLNWRVQEPDGEFFTRDALQEFKQDKEQPGHLLNHDNEYLHYEDDWWILDYEYDNNADGVPPFALVYYRGSNDAWDGYGGATVYTRDSKMPESLRPRLRAAAAKVNYDFDRDFSLTDNSCPTQTTGDKTMLREQFAGKVALQTEKQLQAQATRVRGNAANSIKAQKLFFDKEAGPIEKAFKLLEEKTKEFEDEGATDARRLEKEVVGESEK